MLTERDKAALGWSIPANLRWLAEQSDRPGYTPCGALTGRLLCDAADRIETQAARAAAAEEAGDMKGNHMMRGISEERFLVRLSDSDVAEIILATADAAHPPSVGNGWSRYREAVVAKAVEMGRRLGKRTGLEPLDDALRSCVDGELIDLVRANDPGRRGWIASLERLRGFLERYPERGRPDDGGPGIPPEFPQVDVTVPPSPLQAVAAARLTLQRYSDGRGPFTPGDADRIVKALEAWWKLAPIRSDGPGGGAGPEDADHG